MFATNMVMMAISALIAPYLQNLSGHSVADTGLADGAPRPWHDGRDAVHRQSRRRFDQRKMMAAGLIILGITLYAMSGWTPDVSGRELVRHDGGGRRDGAGVHPAAVVGFTTLSAALRGDATSMLSLARNVGAAIGISVTTFMLARQRAGQSAADLARDRHSVSPPALWIGGYRAMAQSTATSQGAQLLDRMMGFGRPSSPTPMTTA